MNNINPSKRYTCHGCAHENSDSCKEENVHEPSGEIACMNCKRNPQLKDLKDNYVTIEVLRKKWDIWIEKQLKV